MKELIIVGGGGHALSLLESMPDDMKVVGYTALKKSDLLDLPWLGDESRDASIPRLPFPFHVAFIYGGTPRMKKRGEIIDTFAKGGADFTTIIAPSALISPNSKVGHGVAVLSGAIVNRAILGDHVVVNTGAIVEHDCKIGRNSFIGPGAILGGGVTIGNDSFIGLGARIRNGVSIGDDITVGMGAIVTSNLTEPGIYYGNPLRHHPFES